MIKNKKSFAVMCLSCCLLFGCGEIEQTESFLENTPDPEIFFEGSECSKYEVERLHLKGITVAYSGEDIEEAYSDYVESCEQSGIWVHPVFDGDTSWCYMNEDQTLQIAVNLRDDTIDIIIKSLNGED